MLRLSPLVARLPAVHNAHYDSLDGAVDWAKKSIALHANDKREHTYTLAEFELGCTHDDLWNAAQLQMVHEGKMHGWLRMYWCKKIVEWSPTHDFALKTSIYLNDKYEIDGRDPNGMLNRTQHFFKLCLLHCHCCTIR